MIKNKPANAEDLRDTGSIPWRRAWQPTPVLLPGESLGQRSLAGCSPWGQHKELDTNEATGKSTSVGRRLILPPTQIKAHIST